MKKYIIFKRFHYSNFFPSFKKTKESWTLEKDFIFDESCKYEIEEKSSVNKLFGLCFGLFGVHKNSVRFGWTYDKDINSIFIWRYVWKDGKLNKKKIKSVEINTRHNYVIDFKRVKETTGYTYSFIFKVDGETLAEDFVRSESRYMLTLGPYFGGNTRAPHKIFVQKV